MTAPLAYDLRGAADAVQVSEKHLQREIHGGRLAAKKIGRGYRIAAVELKKWFDALPDAD